MFLYVYWLCILTVVLAKSAHRTSRDPAVSTIYACENDDLTITCNPTYFIRIVSAVYGRQNTKTCSGGDTSNTQCNARTSVSEMQDRCNNQETCTVTAGNDVFGDPCVGIHKYLQVSYQCIECQKCCVNEVFDVEHSTCEESCNQTCPDKQKQCVSSPGCSCASGYIRDVCNSGKCVQPDRCPYYNPVYPDCTTFEEYNPCGNNCTVTCDVDNRDDVCTQQCVPGFFCLDGYMREALGGRCIKPEDCECCIV